MPERQQVARGQVVDRNADAHRPLARQAGDRHQPAHALRDLIDAGAMAVRPVLAEAADAAVDDARVDRLHVVVRHLQPVLHLGAHVLDDDVGGLHQAHERRVALRRLQVQRHRALVAVQVLEVEAVAVAGDVLAVGRRRLDLDDVGAPVGEMPHAGGSRARQRQVQHLQAVQRHAGLRLAQHRLVGGALRHPWSPLGPGADTLPQSAEAQEWERAGRGRREQCYISTAALASAAGAKRFNTEDVRRATEQQGIAHRATAMAALLGGPPCPSALPPC